MPIPRAAFTASVAVMLFASPLWAEGGSLVVGAQRSQHVEAPAAEGGEGDYGFSASSGAQTPAPKTPAPDADLLAYDEEEALIEAEAALAAGDAGDGAVVID